MTKWLDPITAARADLELEVARLREENDTIRAVNKAQADRIEALSEQIRRAQQRRIMARSGE